MTTFDSDRPVGKSADQRCNLTGALAYARRGWEIFPCRWHGKFRKYPLTENGRNDASADPNIITSWWSRWPQALIGFATGRANRIVVLDVDVKNGTWGFDTLRDLGFAILPETPISHTRSGGIHLFFVSDIEIRNTEGERGRGIGKGLDWRGTGGFIILPSPDSGYYWDPHCNPDTTDFAVVPTELLPREPDRPSGPQYIEPTEGLSRYAEVALRNACSAIANAPNQQQEATLHAQCFAIGSLAGAGGIPADFAQSELLWAAYKMPSYDPKWPWHPTEIKRHIKRSFALGLGHPR